MSGVEKFILGVAVLVGCVKVFISDPYYERMAFAAEESRVRTAIAHQDFMQTRFWRRCGLYDVKCLKSSECTTDSDCEEWQQAIYRGAAS